VTASWRLSPEPERVITGIRFAASAETVWVGLMFYEELPRRPPLLLRLILPAPTRAEGRKSAVGDQTRCLYEGGHLVKRITSIDRLRHSRFEIAEQRLRIAGGVRLEGGGYSLSELPDGSTRVELETRYISPWFPRWLCRPIEAAVCHAFHRHLLGAMRRAVESSPEPPVPASPRAAASPSF
jgi:hypothetical protein